MNAIVLTFDRLPTSFLACYGNNWIETPNFDRFAAQAATFHQHFAESLVLDTIRHAWWSGCYECRRADEPRTSDLLPAVLAARGISVRMLLESGGDNHEGSARDLLRLFPEWTELIAGGCDGLDVPPDETPFFRLIARAQRDLRLLRTSRSEPWLLWIKSRGVPIPWLPPAEYARKFLDIADDDSESDADADDAERATAEEVDNDVLEEDEGAVVEMSDAQFEELLHRAASLPQGRAERDARTDFDRALSRKVLGGYLAYLDAGLGRFLESVDQSAAGGPTLVVVTAAHGLAVHDAGVLRDEWQAASDETVHVPLMVRLAGSNQGVRRQSLTLPTDLFPTLLDWFGLERPESALDGHSLLPVVRGEQPEVRKVAFAADRRSITTVRTADHYLVQKTAAPDSEEGQGSEPARRLFAKPEDAWEVNELAAQIPQVVEELVAEGERLFGVRPAETAH